MPKCEFCEIDGYGNHAPRCPEELESVIVTITKEMERDKKHYERHLAGALDMRDKELDRAEAADKKVAEQKRLILDLKQCNVDWREQFRKDTAALPEPPGILAVLMAEHEAVRECNGVCVWRKGFPHTCHSPKICEAHAAAEKLIREK